MGEAAVRVPGTGADLGVHREGGAGAGPAGELGGREVVDQGLDAQDADRGQLAVGEEAAQQRVGAGVVAGGERGARGVGGGDEAAEAVVRVNLAGTVIRGREEDALHAGGAAAGERRCGERDRAQTIGEVGHGDRLLVGAAVSVAVVVWGLVGVWAEVGGERLGGADGRREGGGDRQAVGGAQRRQGARGCVRAGEHAQERPQGGAEGHWD